jgi:hypothetical protein
MVHDRARSNGPQAFGWLVTTCGHVKVYFEYNLLGRLLEQRADQIPRSNDQRWIPDHRALEKIYNDFKEGCLVLTICKEDSLEEFVAYDPDAIHSYNDVHCHLPERMVLKFELFDSLKHGELLIAPWGDYGFGCGPYGGGDSKHYELLYKIRESLGNVAPASSQADRDARHLMHSILYRCDYFLTMDYKTIVNKLSPLPAILQRYLQSNGFFLNVITPSGFLTKFQGSALSAGEFGSEAFGGSAARESDRA